MKKITLIAIAILSLVACEKENNRDKTVSIELYYYGRSILYYTFEIPVKIYEGDKKVLDLVLWSMDSTLEEGKYTICPKGETGSWPSMRECVTNTYSYTKSYLYGSLITDGEIEVSKSGDIYSFVVNLKNAKGKRVSKTYKAEIKNRECSKLSPHKGFFSNLALHKASEYNYNEGKTKMFLISGDFLKIYGRQIVFVFYHTDTVDPTGRYTIGDSNIQYAYFYKDANADSDKMTQISSGWFEIKRRDKVIKPSTGVNTYINYTVEIDIISEDGERIKGRYINGDYSSDYQ